MKFLQSLNPANEGVLPRAVEAVEYGAASYMLGYSQNRWRDKAAIAGAPVDLLAGVVLKGAALFCTYKGGKWGSSALCAQGNILGNAALGAFTHTLGAGHGAQKSGVARLMVPADQVEKIRKLIPSTTVFGAIPKAPHGDYLSPADLAELAK